MSRIDLTVLRDRAAILQALESFPDSADLTSDEAALYLGISKKTLLRWRNDYRRDWGGQPAPAEPGEAFPSARQAVRPGSMARNQHLRWRKSDLRQWRDRGMLRSTDALDGAVQRGMALVTAADAFKENPWLFGPQGCLGHAQTASDEVFDAWRQRQGVDVVIGTLEEAVLEWAWIEGGDREAFCDLFRDLLMPAMSHMNAKSSAITLARELK
jgi:hypothetical protein